MEKNKQFDPYLSIPKEKFAIVENHDTHDAKLETKPVGYLKDAFRRFCKNKASVTASIIIIFLILFALLGPFLSSFDTTFNDIDIAYLLPKCEPLEFLGWDGYEKQRISNTDYLKYRAIEHEVGVQVIKKVYSEEVVETKNGPLSYVNKFYTVDLNSYTKNIVKKIQLTKEDYDKLQAYQDQHNLQIILPMVNKRDANNIYKDDYTIWYQIQNAGLNKGYPVGTTYNDTEINIEDFKNDYLAYTGSDDYTSKMRVEEGTLYNYARKVGNGNNYEMRVNYNLYFEYKHGQEPSFLFGTDQFGKDIFVNLSSGARFSLIFAVCISAINLIIGAIYGAIEGYYGGAADMIMERVSDILGGVPFMIVVTLFKLHIMDKVGVVVTLLFAFVLTGWIGMASTTRMQFYRYKNQEYVLAARTLGAKDGRIMFKHIFPNALGTLITSCVLVIPGVIFSESSLSYLGIVNLSTGSITSVGTLMANGKGTLTTNPHIILFPSCFIALLMITFNLFGNGLRDAFNPSLRGTED